MSDSDSSVSDVSDFDNDYVSSDSDQDEERLVINIPSSMAIYGKSMSGKTTFFLDLLAGNNFEPQPELFFLLIPKTGVEKADREKMKEFVETVNTTYTPYDKHENAIVVVHDVEELNTELSKAKADIPKLVFIDDMLTENLMKGIMSIINEMMHRTNSCVALTTQMLFIRNAKAIKDNSNYLVIFPGQPSLKKFLQDYPTRIVKYVSNSLSEQRDEEWDVEEIQTPKPVIIVKNDRLAEVTVWRDVFDIEPLTMSLHKEDNQNTSSTGQQVRKLIIDKQQQFNNQDNDSL